MKTIEEAATDFSKDIRENSLTGNNAGKQQYQVGRKIGFNAGVEFAQRWIPVEEERPEPGLIVLIKRPNYHLAFFDGLRWSDINKGFLDDVTHWRRLELK